MLFLENYTFIYFRDDSNFIIFLFQRKISFLPCRISYSAKITFFQISYSMFEPILKLMLSKRIKSGTTCSSREKYFKFISNILSKVKPQNNEIYVKCFFNKLSFFIPETRDKNIYIQKNNKSDKTNIYKKDYLLK